MAGAWNSLVIAWPAVLLGAAIGTAIGCTAAALRGAFDEIAMRSSDVIFAFPAVLSAIMLGALVGSGPFAAVLAIAVFNVPVFARVSRAVALQVWTFDYVAAARSLGKHPWRITWEDVLPNIAGVLIVQATIQLALAILTEAGFTGEQRVIALRGLLGYVIGAIQLEHLGSLSGEGTVVISALPPDEFPYMAETARQAQNVSADQEFIGGLTVLLRGLRA
jgi:ABC-type dipeptide/oligopeptide/nickel transport system permease component